MADVELSIRIRAKDSSSRAFKSAQKSAKSLGRALVKVGAVAAKAGVIGLAAVGFAAVSMAAKFESAMSQSLAIMGEVTDKLRGDMSDAAREVALTTTFSAKEAAEAYFFLASAGFDAAASIEALPKVAAFAQAGMFDMALATDLLTDAQSALGLKSEDLVKNMENMARVSDVLVGANTLANASVQQFSEALTNKAGAALRATNKDIEEGVAVLAVFADQGIKGADAGTQLGIVLRDLQTKALKNQDAFAKMGIAVFDSQGNMNNMADIIGDVEGALSGMSTAQQKATLLQLGFSDKSVASLQALIGNSEAIREYEGALRDMGGITDEVADKQLQNFTAQMSLLKSQFDDAMITLGNRVLPTLTRFATWLRTKGVPLAKDFAKTMKQEFQPAIDAVRDAFAALAPKFQAVGRAALFLLPVFKDNEKTMKIAAFVVGSLLVGAFVVLTAAVIAYTISMVVAAAPMIAAIVIIAALSLGIALLIKNWDKVEGVMGSVADGFATAGRAVSDFATGSVRLVTDLAIAFIRSGQDMMTGIARGIASGASGVFSVIAAFVSGIISLINPANWRVASTLTEAYDHAGQEAGTAMVEALLNSVRRVSVVGAEIIKPLQLVRDFVSELQGELGRLIGLPTIEGAGQQLSIARLRLDLLGKEAAIEEEQVKRLQRLGELREKLGLARAAGSSNTIITSLERQIAAVESNRTAVELEGEAIERQLKVLERAVRQRGLEVDILRLRGLEADKTLLRDADLATAAEKMIDVIGLETGAIATQVGVIQTQYLPRLDEAKIRNDDLAKAVGGAGDAVGEFDASDFVAEVDSMSDAAEEARDEVTAAFEDMKTDIGDVLGDLKDDLAENWEEIVQSALNILYPQGGGLFLLVTHAGEIRDGIVSAFEEIPGLLEGLGDDIVDAIGSTGINDLLKKGLDLGLDFAGVPFRRNQHGGPLRAGQLSLVGEAGPELFVPSTDGAIIPNHKLGRGGSAGGGTTINVTLNATVFDGTSFEARHFAREIGGLVAHDRRVV